MDTLSKQQRSKNMRAIRSQNTKPERIISDILCLMDVDYIPHSDELCGRPDFVCENYKSVIFVNGCFWHRHLCYLFRWPETRKDYWYDKLHKNAKRFNYTVNKLNDSGYKVLVIWECALKGKKKIDLSIIKDCIEEWLCAGDKNCEIDTSGIKGISVITEGD
ncbi:very short patch repair endonuclease [Photorhabdus luminescens]|uniref:very short patch repair endonuclease n=1 Tax=Photorhabdus akhurstii TaxID=171438 RepID=UPI000CFA2F08|nr:DNA mismatch endonuclease Vsr [Photorhabdus akhurstii]MBS9429347.1 DNA mismatch endonuclease Vsr [Photorhabdus akhurstii]PQQ32077.1 very short patch repair endonuclease [Photorhabdus luminescens]PQQ42447.1 very short patch repair endonuclease [Photorhabdus luminescens]